MSQNIFTVIDQMENAAKIPALRTITHSMMVRVIGACRQHIRNAQRPLLNNNNGSTLAAPQREEGEDAPGAPEGGLDQRNSYDENTRSISEIMNAIGFPESTPPIAQAEAYHEVYEWAKSRLCTLTNNRFELPLDIDGMLGFMTTNTQQVDKAFVEKLAEVLKVKPEHILKLHEVQDLQDRERLIAMAPEIKAMFNSFTHDVDHEGYKVPDDQLSDGFDGLPPIAKHQLGVKVVEGLGKAKDRTLMNILRTKRITDLAAMPLMDEGIKLMTSWVLEYEKEHKAEFEEALNAGVNIRSLEQAQ